MVEAPSWACQRNGFPGILCICRGKGTRVSAPPTHALAHCVYIASQASKVPALPTLTLRPAGNGKDQGWG